MNSLRRGTFLVTSAEYASKCLVYGILLLQIRRLAPEDFGRLSAVLGLFQAIAMCVDGGLGQLVAKHLAGSDAPQWKRIVSLRLLLFAGGLVAAPMAAMLLLDTTFTRTTLILLAWAVLSFSFVDFFAWALKGRRQFGRSAGLQVSSRIIFFLFCAGALLFSGTVAAFSIAYGTAGLVSAVLVPTIVAKRLPPLSLEMPNMKWLRSIAVELGPLCVFLAGGVLMARGDILLIAGLDGAGPAGLYAAAAAIVEGLALAPFALFAVLMPIFTSVHSDLGKQRVMFSTVAPPAVLTSIIAAAMASIFTPRMFQVFFDPEYQAAVSITQWMVWTVIPITVSYLLSARLMANGRFWAIATSMLAGVMTMMAMDVLLLPWFGWRAASVVRLARMVQ